jgi:hypothetical protein
MGRNPRTVQTKLKVSSKKEASVQVTLKAVREKETLIQTKLKYEMGTTVSGYQ